MRDGRYLAAFFAVVIAAGAWSGQAGAENLDIDELAAALVLPVITGADGPNPLKAGVRGDVVIPNQSARTLATVTNGWSESVILQVDVISGDVVAPGEPSDACQTQSFVCPLTARETTTFVFSPWEDGKSRVDVECSTVVRDPAGNIIDVTSDPDPKAMVLNAQNGIMFVSVADPLAEGHPTVSSDVLIGDAVVVDSWTGLAYSFSAISFQAGQGANDGDKVYAFDGLEYAKFPAALAANFLAPGRTTGANRVDAELILFTLDFATGNLPLPRSAIGGLTYNDDEEYCDWGHEFDCFEITALEDIDACNSIYPAPSSLGLGSISGHLEMHPQAIATANDSHDATSGTGTTLGTAASTAGSCRARRISCCPATSRFPGRRWSRCPPAPLRRGLVRSRRR